jgi:hypothetical protein
MERVMGIVTYSKPWEMTDENTGVTRKGITVEYMMTDCLVPLQNDDGSQGYNHCKESLPVSCKDKLEKVPGTYDLIFELGIIKGKPVMKLKDLTYIGKVEVIDKVFSEKKAV